ncbi:protein kinase, partial [Vicingaceae bacterium]|nr:protein kinase [Vicingaceae bacterium]
IADRFTEELELGQTPDIEAYLAQHADFSQVLRPLLTALEEIKTGGLELIADDPKSQKVLGDFRIVREIARGGMGIVYEAEQVSMGRKVALKVLPFASMIDAKPLERFRNEVRAVASLGHPHIVSVYSTGEERGVHYYAMQLIRGQSLVAVIKELQAMSSEEGALSGSSISEIMARSSTNGSASDDSDPNDLGEQGRESENDQAQQDTRAHANNRTVKSETNRNYYSNVARLGIQAAEALAHAHEHGIIHRDIKPGNLMLDAGGQLFVTDFGLARMEAAGVTMTGDWLGTPRYMSPEQALGKQVVIDHRADIYSLGVTLYELLTLKPAFDANDRQELLRQIAHDEPARPRTVNSRIPRDLETILLKSISKSRDDRYDSAQEISDDLQCFLEDKPIKAKPATLVQRGTKWALRHKPLVASAAAFLILASLGLAISNYLILQERDSAQQERTIAEGERATAQNERDEARLQGKRADQNFRRAQAAVDQYLTKVSENELLDVPSLQTLRKELLELALTYYQEFIKDRADDPSLQAELSAAHFRVGKITAHIGSKPNSIESHRIALTLREQLVKANPESTDYQSQLAISRYELAEQLRAIGETPEATELLENIIRDSNELDARDAGDLESRTIRARAFHGLGRVQISTGDFVNSVHSYQKAIDIQQVLVNEDPGADKRMYVLASSFTNLGVAQSMQGNKSEALASHEEALTIYRQLVKLRPDVLNYRYGLALAFSNLAAQPEKSAEAHALITQAIDIQKELVKENPVVADYQFGLATGYCNLAEVHKQNGNSNEEIKILLAGIDILKSLTEKHPAVSDYQSRLAVLTGELATAYCNRGVEFQIKSKYDEALEWMLRSIDVRNGQVGKYAKFRSNQTNLAITHFNVGFIQLCSGQCESAISSINKSNLIWQSLLERNPNHVSRHEFLARCSTVTGDA